MNQTLLPSGDAFIVYPDRARLSVFPSIRLEAMRAGLEDYGLRGSRPGVSERTSEPGGEGIR